MTVWGCWCEGSPSWRFDIHTIRRSPACQHNLSARLPLHTHTHSHPTCVLLLPPNIPLMHMFTLTVCCPYTSCTLSHTLLYTLNHKVTQSQFTHWHMWAPHTLTHTSGPAQLLLRVLLPSQPPQIAAIISRLMEGSHVIATAKWA